MGDLASQFLFQCKANYFDGIRPSNPLQSSETGRLNLITIAKAFIAADKVDKLMGFFVEGQYFVPLWAAHLILEYAPLTADIEIACLDVVRCYTSNPLAPDVALQETRWLENYMDSNSQTPMSKTLTNCDNKVG